MNSNLPSASGEKQGSIHPPKIKELMGYGLCVQKQDDQRGRCSRSPGYMYSHLKYDKETSVL